MEIKPLSKEVISRIQSTSSIHNLTQCVTELVLNSLDAKSSAVAVRLNTLNFRIQVVDNGTGITKENLEKIALKYSTSKCQSLLDLEKKPKTYGYKGESLWTIANIAKTLVITSKYATSENTFSKSICSRKHEKVTIAKRRQSNGTTVTIDGLFNNLPVRQKRMKKEFEFEEIIRFLKSMSIIHPLISITLRDDLTGKLLFKRPKNENVIKSFTDLYPDIKYDETVVIKVQKDKVSLEALLLKDIFSNKPIQHIFVNKRPVQHTKLQAFFCKEITKQSKKKMQSVNGLHPTFVLNIKCSLSKYTITYENSEAKVEFLNIDLIYRCVEKLILNFLGKSEPIVEENKIRGKRKSVCGVSDLGGVVKCFGFKDWLKRKELDNEGTEFIEEVTEQSKFGKETVDSKKKYKNSNTKKDKLKSLPIKIYEQNQNKPIHSRENGDNQNKNTYDKYKERDSHDKYMTSIQNHNDKSTGKIMMENFHRLEINCQDILSKHKHEETLFSNFTNTEKKGKDFLMYMFLKSTEMFNGETSQQTPQISVENSNANINNSIETIMESNIFYQNITKTKNHHLSENISVSVRLKRRKNVKTHDEHSLISEKYTFSKPESKKRKIGYSNEKRKLSDKAKLLKSPYFGVKKGDHKTIAKKHSIQKQNGMNFVTEGDIKTDIFFTERIDDNKNFTILNSCFSTTNHFENIRNFNVKKCSDEFSMSNVCFLNFSKKIFCDQNKTYLFNFENVSTNNGHNNISMRQNFLRDASKNTLALNTRMYEKSFDFKNLPVSPIPKVLTLSKETPSNAAGVNQKLKPALFNFPESSKKTERTWKKYVSEGDFQKNSSPYFAKRENFKKFDGDFSFPQEHFGCPQNNIRKGPEKIFRRYHTEPLDNSRLQYIHKTKENIDKLFIDLKYKKLDAGENHLFLLNKDNYEVFTRDSLEKDTQIKTPLWKKFIMNKRARSEIKRKFKGHSHFEMEKNSKTVTQKKSNYFKSKMTPNEDNIGESPDLFSEAKINESCRKAINDLTFFPNSAISIDIDAVFGDKPDDDCKDMRTLTAVGTAAVSGTANSSNLIISLNRENEKDVTNTAAIFNQNFDENGWIKRLDQEGNEFYFNKITGITSFLHPKTEEDIYLLKRRSEFIPKGLSPIIVPSQQLEKSLSPISKEKLHDEILKSYKEDLGLVKWEKCIEGYDPKYFFENLYKEKLNAYEREIPNIIIGKIPKFSFQLPDDNKFNKIVFKNLSVIGQIDRKFIAAIDKNKNINLIIFDQHAVHERIRLEDLLREYEGKSSTCEKVTLFMKQTDLDLIENHQKYLNGIGIHYIIFGNGITIDKVPSCLLNKCSKEVHMCIILPEPKLQPEQKFAINSYNQEGIIYSYLVPSHLPIQLPLSKLIQLLVREVLDLVKETRGVLTGSPKMINQIINMEACRGSVKFGELLTQDEMEQLIEKLSKCNLPFQCAHGRPTLIPLLNLDSKVEENERKLKLRSLRRT